MKYCVRCGQALAEERFCISCGYPAAGDAPAAAGPAPGVVSAPWGSAGGPPPRPPGSGRGLQVLAAAIALVLLGSAGWLVLRQRDRASPGQLASSSTATASPSGPTAASSSPAVAASPTLPTTPTPTPTPTPPVVSPPLVLPYPPPVSTPFFTVVVGSKRTSAEAERLAPRIAAAGFTPLVFLSNSYSHLTPGYWVAAAGAYSTRGQANAASATVQTYFPEINRVYPRCVGSDAECAGLGG